MKEFEPFNGKNRTKILTAYFSPVFVFSYSIHLNLETEYLRDTAFCRTATLQ